MLRAEPLHAEWRGRVTLTKTPPCGQEVHGKMHSQRADLALRPTPLLAFVSKSGKVASIKAVNKDAPELCR